MRTKYADQRRELENAFSFGQRKQQSVLESPIRNRHINKNIKFYDKDRQNRDCSAKTIKHQRDGIKNKNDYIFKQKQMRIKDNLPNYGKSIYSQPIQDSMELISRVFRQEGLKIQQTLNNKIEVENVRFYNPSIEKIKNKYGLNNSKSTITKSNSFLKPISLHHIDLQVYDKQTFASKSPSKSYKYQNNSRINYCQNQSKKTIYENKYLINNRSSKTPTKFNHFQNKHNIRQNSPYEYQKNQLKNITMVSNNFLPTPLSNNSFINNYNPPLSPSFGQSKLSSNNSQILKSISDLDSKINQKLNKIIPLNNY